MHLLATHWPFGPLSRRGTYKAKVIVTFFSRPSPKAGRELQTELDRRRMMEGGGPLAKDQPEPVTGP